MLQISDDGVTDVSWRWPFLGVIGSEDHETIVQMMVMKKGTSESLKGWVTLEKSLMNWREMEIYKEEQVYLAC